MEHSRSSPALLREYGVNSTRIGPGRGGWDSNSRAGEPRRDIGGTKPARIDRLLRTVAYGRLPGFAPGDRAKAGARISDGPEALDPHTPSARLLGGVDRRLE